jgi:Fic family protein
MNVRMKGDWEGWLRFFLRGVSDTARLATETGRKILAMRETQRNLFSRNTYALALLDSLFAKPYVDVKQAATIMACSFVKANNVVRELETAGILQEITGNARNRVFRYQPFLAVFEQQNASASTFEPAAVRGRKS